MSASHPSRSSNRPDGSAWRHPQVRELAALPHDWHSTGSIAPTPAALQTADRMALVPRTDGGLVYELHAGGVAVEIEIDPDGQIRDLWMSRHPATLHDPAPSSPFCEGDPR